MRFKHKIVANDIARFHVHCGFGPVPVQPDIDDKHRVHRHFFAEALITNQPVQGSFASTISGIINRLCIMGGPDGREFDFLVTRLVTFRTA
jgi:hypothetical protein